MRECSIGVDVLDGTTIDLSLILSNIPNTAIIVFIFFFSTWYLVLVHQHWYNNNSENERLPTGHHQMLDLPQSQVHYHNHP